MRGFPATIAASVSATPPSIAILFTRQWREIISAHAETGSLLWKSSHSANACNFLKNGLRLSTGNALTTTDATSGASFSRNSASFASAAFVPSERPATPSEMKFTPLSHTTFLPPNIEGVAAAAMVFSHAETASSVFPAAPSMISRDISSSTSAESSSKISRARLAAIKSSSAVMKYTAFAAIEYDVFFNRGFVNHKRFFCLKERPKRAIMSNFQKDSHITEEKCT